jgi:hypothetical protein
MQSVLSEDQSAITIFQNFSLKDNPIDNILPEINDVILSV